MSEGKRGEKRKEEQRKRIRETKGRRAAEERGETFRKRNNISKQSNKKEQ